MSQTAAHTPLIQQYLDIKAQHPDAILFFRVGDFYEMFFDDAREGSQLLGITLTSRNNGSSDVPLAGVPAKAVGDYLPRLVREGRRVAVCEQMEEAGQAEGLVRREVTEIITPGATLEDSLLAAGRNNFLAAIGGADPDGCSALSTVDLSTGETEIWECPTSEIGDELRRIGPSEVLVPGDAIGPDGTWLQTGREAWRFGPEVGIETIRRVYGVAGVEGFGLVPGADDHLIGAFGALLSYLEEVRPSGVSHLNAPIVLRRGGHLHLDEMTRRNLELVDPIRDGEGSTLLTVLDRTQTAMGRRAMRRRLLRPMLDPVEIGDRLDAVEELFDRTDARSAMRSSLARIRDIERLTAKIAANRILPRELLALAESLAALPELAGTLDPPRSRRLAGLTDGLSGLEDIRERIECTIDPASPPTLAAGGVIRGGCSEALDGLRSEREQAVDAITGLQTSERRSTGIDNLKIGFNKVFGYYIEVTRSQLEKVPEHYQRKQTLTGAERFVTPELKAWEQAVVEADVGIAEHEGFLYRELRLSLASDVGRIQAVARQVAELDVFAGLAEAASKGRYVRPVIADEFGLDIRAGRHPVVEQMISRESFIPNDVRLDQDEFVMVLTGPNMAGKSTLLRQVGLIVLMAQIGSFVPAAAARIGLCDRVFTR
ncbi:MAG: DNA mismatch repair protein MutS, partial [Gemmatimonadota bacterium]